MKYLQIIKEFEARAVERRDSSTAGFNENDEVDERREEHPGDTSSTSSSSCATETDAVRQLRIWLETGMLAALPAALPAFYGELAAYADREQLIAFVQMILDASPWSLTGQERAEQFVAILTPLIARAPLPVPSAARWDAGTEDRIEWLRNAQVPTDQPFRLQPGVTVSDPGRYFADLMCEIAQGPDGPRARYGALQADLRHIEAWAAAGYPPATIPPSERREVAREDAVQSIRDFLARGLPVFAEDGHVHYAQPAPGREGIGNPATVDDDGRSEA